MKRLDARIQALQLAASFITSTLEGGYENEEVILEELRSIAGNLEVEADSLGRIQPRPGEPAYYRKFTPKPERRGRKRMAEDDWAWDQVHTHGRDPTDVRKEWESRMTEERRLSLKDIKRSYRHAIDAERRAK